ncbi:hypothetical protein CY34DRAFT_801198 [Suillus luteus UH-Slu-Lm8-n1]|uniref:Uncharacterized protein n=1 Tax=Suillus luteus UH-Slu-Lm8-n1 TaxID=930992 RepID=A0A0D0B7C5_9AGAM|nr:hypothetical protein CY34DRAFT_801198 [Suillus luteus UH-Slu-Lm8-n1]
MSQLLTEIRGGLGVSVFGVCRLLTQAVTRGDLLDESNLVLSNVVLYLCLTTRFHRPTALTCRLFIAPGPLAPSDTEGR